jgi:ABC-2 type transport system ATP-binding protein
MEFLKFTLRLYKTSRSEADIIEGAEKLALDPKALKRRVQTYSKGMRQKLGLLATLLTDCKLLLLDEPMSGLDPLARALVKDMLTARKNKRQSVFLSSHILVDMDEMCDRVAVLHGGIIHFVGTPEELKVRTGSQNLERAFLHFVEKDKAA